MSERISSFFSNLLDTIFGHKSSDHTAEQNLLKDLGTVRKEVQKEFQWFHEGCLVRFPDDNDCLEAKRKRLLFLFIRDLMSGVGGNVLDNKDKRDNLKSKKVEPWIKFSSWVFVILLNGGMLFYVYLFARTQTQSRQTAWFISFVMWLIFEILVSSTAVVFFTHLLIPLYVLSDLRNIKKKVLTDILIFRKTALQRKQRQQQGDGFDSLALLSSSTEFNAAKYLYRSWRVAFLFPKIKESEIILSFQTPWPQHSFKKVTATVHSSYERRYSFIYQAISRVAIFFLASLLNLPQFAQDCFIQITSSSGLGYLGVLFIRLYNLSPFLVAVPLFCAGIMIHFGVNATIRSEQLRRAQDLHPIEEEMSTQKPSQTSGKASDDVSPAAATTMTAPRGLGGVGDSDDGDEKVEWEEDDEDMDSFFPSNLIPSAATAAAPAREKITEGRKMSQLMLSNLQKDIAARHHLQSSGASPNPNPSVLLPVQDDDERFQEVYWSDSDDEDVKELERLSSPPPQAKHPEPSLPSDSDPGSDGQKIIWEDDDSPADEDSLDITVDFWDSNGLKELPLSQDSSDFSPELESLDSYEEEDEDSLGSSHLSSLLPDSVDELR
jgi:hypothetical protein